MCFAFEVLHFSRRRGKVGIGTEIVNLTSAIAAFNAISGTRKENNKRIYTELEKIARVQSVKGSNAIEGIVTTDARIKEIVDENSAPLNHSEREIAVFELADVENEIEHVFLTLYRTETVHCVECILLKEDEVEKLRFPESWWT